MNTEPTMQLPGQWSTFGVGYDWLFYFIYWLSVVLFVVVVGAALYFVVKYRRRPGVKSEPTGHYLLLEIGWTVSPLILLVMLFHWGFAGYVSLTAPPPDALDIRVRARKWSWDFEYPNGGHSQDELHVPVGRPVRLILSSEDVIHAMYIPGFRVKRDAVPGSYSTLWFEATHVGRTRYFCAEYCGAAEQPVHEADGTDRYTGHFSMNGWVNIHPVDGPAAESVSGENTWRSGWASYLENVLRAPIDPATGHEVTPAQWGELLYARNQCNTCHSVNGSAMTGPTWQHMFGQNVDLADGTHVLVDENYVRESILQPAVKVVRGFNPVMPSYQGSLTDRQLDALIAYIRTLR